MDHNAGPLADTEVHHLASSHVGDEFKIFVGHCGTQLREPLPVLYLTDANGCFGVAVDTIRSMQLVRLIPPLLVVGIGYPRGILAETASIRVRDLTPTRDEIYDRLYPDNCGMSGADRFLAFIRSELMPWVAQRFPVEFGDSIYFGHSLGGLFGTVVMLSEPDTFARYILGSPSYWWDRNAIVDIETRYASDHADLRAHVFFGIGADEDHAGRVRELTNAPERERAIAEKYRHDMVATMLDLIARLEQRDYPSLTTTSRVFADESHVTVAPLVLSHGLRWHFSVPGPDVG